MLKNRKNKDKKYCCLWIKLKDYFASCSLFSSEIWWFFCRLNLNVIFCFFFCFFSGKIQCYNGVWWFLFLKFKSCLFFFTFFRKIKPDNYSFDNLVFSLVSYLFYAITNMENLSSIGWVSSVVCLLVLLNSFCFRVWALGQIILKPFTGSFHVLFRKMVSFGLRLWN